MSWRKSALLVFVFCVASVSCAHAQREFEITPFGGSRFGGQIDESSAVSPTVSYDYLGIKSSLDYGVMGDVTIWPNFQGEFMFSRQPTELSGICVVCGTRTDLTSANIDMYQFGVLYAFRSPEAKLKPYVVGGLGLTNTIVETDKEDGEVHYKLLIAVSRDGKSMKVRETDRERDTKMTYIMEKRSQ